MLLSSTTGGNIGNYGVVNVNGSCLSFAGSVCTGTVFYNGQLVSIFILTFFFLVYTNGSYTQEEMSSDADYLYSFENLPGVTDTCR